MTDLTCKQFKVYEFIKDFIKDKQYPPSCRDIATGFSINTKSAQDYLKVIEKKGYIKRISGQARGIVVIKQWLIMN